MYICSIQDRHYKEWSYDPPCESLASPAQYKLFDGDVFNNNGDGTIEIIKSPLKSMQNIPGILLLENNRTYGRTTNKKRLYYKCRPNDSKIPSFLVPYDLSMGFHKNFKNKYITFYFHHWKEKHPCGRISQNLGDVYDLPSFNEYQLYCKSLHHSITASIAKTKEIVKIFPLEGLQKKILDNAQNYGEFQRKEESDEYIFTVDPRGCLDRDDALSISTKIKNDIIEHTVNVYIANVWVWLDLMNLWELIGTRVSTIYFPEMKRPMLPTSIGEELCSLDQNKMRFAFMMSFNVVEHPKKGVYIQYLDGMRPTVNQCTIKVSKNYCYEEPLLIDNSYYQALKKLTIKMDSKTKDSHDVVAFWMMQMNIYMAKHMKFHKMGIFRTVKSKTSTVVPDELPSFIKIWEQQISGSYELCDDNKSLNHDILGISQYVHFTSPIRRMVDLLNQMDWIFTYVKPTSLNPMVLEFYNSQVENIDNLNKDMKKIRRIQSDAHILHTVTNEPSILENTYNAKVITVGEKYTLYIEELQWITQTTLPFEKKKFENVLCKLFVFEKEEKMRKKIRIQVL